MYTVKNDRTLLNVHIRSYTNSNSEPADTYYADV